MDNHTNGNPDSSGSPDGGEQLAFIRQETRFEIGLLHERVNALVGAEAFLTIAFTAAMSNGTAWGARFSAVVSPILSVLGLLLALLAWPGIQATAGLIVRWNARQLDLVERNPALSATMWGLAVRGPGDRRVGPDQWRSMLFFRAAPGLFALAWTILTVIALVIRH